MGPMALIIVSAAATIIMFVFGIYQLTTRRKMILAQRVEAYGSIEEEAALTTETELQKLSPVARFLHVLLGRRYIQSIEDELSRADLPMRASEYILLRVTLAAVSFLIGFYVFGYLHSGLMLAVVGFFVPAIIVSVHQHRRRAKFVRQLADALMLLTNSLRSGYSFLKGLELIAKEMNDPISKELSRMLREVNLGATTDQALLNMGKRLNSQDLDIVISAFLVQKDVGGNLTEIMEKVAETIRERLRIQGDIRVLTAQGRLSGLIVGLLPFAVGLTIVARSPEYFKIMIGPPMVPLIGPWSVPQGVLVLIAAGVLQLIGAYLIFKIVSIKV